MQVSAEVRWFWEESLPTGLDDWFHSGIAVFQPGGGLPRLDEYLLDIGQIELGVKKRGEKPGIEIKGLLRTLPSPVQFGSLAGSIQLWGKWTTTALQIDGLRTVATQKTRWLRKYDATRSVISEIELDQRELPARTALPSQGCNVEIASIAVDNLSKWWTLGCEAFGPFERIERIIRQTLDHLGPMNVPLLRGLELSYPAWLSRFATQPRQS
jgi:hypothetical protein